MPHRALRGFRFAAHEGRAGTSPASTAPRRTEFARALTEGPRRDSLVPLAARPSFADWIRETTRNARAGAELSGSGKPSSPQASGLPVHANGAQIPKRSAGEGSLVPLAARPSFADWIRETTRDARAGAEVSRSGVRSSTHPGEPNAGARGHARRSQTAAKARVPSCPSRRDQVSRTGSAKRLATREPERRSRDQAFGRARIRASRTPVRADTRADRRPQRRRGSPRAPRGATKFRGLDPRNDSQRASRSGGLAIRRSVEHASGRAERRCARTRAQIADRSEGEGPLVPLAARPSFADWIRETTRNARAGAEVSRSGVRSSTHPGEPNAGARGHARRSQTAAEARVRRGSDPRTAR